METQKNVKQLEYVDAERLIDHINYLIDSSRFCNNDIAIEALDAVKFWVIEETIPPA